jgi:hypothetical protein
MKKKSAQQSISLIMLEAGKGFMEGFASGLAHPERGTNQYKQWRKYRSSRHYFLTHGKHGVKRPA